MRLQKSDQLPYDAVKCDKTTVIDGSIRMKRCENSFVYNLRAYLDTISDAIKCSMDVQSSNGDDMILRYVTSYVSKWKDGLNSEGITYMT